MAGGLVCGVRGFSSLLVSSVGWQGKKINSPAAVSARQASRRPALQAERIPAAIAPADTAGSWIFKLKVPAAQ
jgi:hypothetical protein